jgi:diguanylate cyclase (GGDEF)-like protein
MLDVRHRFVTGVGLFLLCLAVVIALVISKSHPLQQAVVDLISVAMAVSAVIICTIAALHTKDRHVRWFWGLYAAAMMFSAIAEAMWATYELAFGRENPLPSIADLVWLVSYPLSFTALIRLSAGRRRENHPETFLSLDALLFSLAGAALAWEFLMIPVLGLGTDRLTVITSLAYPMGDLLLLGGLASLGLSASRRSLPKGTTWIVASVLVMLAADVAYTRMNVHGTYATGAWVDPLWPLGYALTSIAALTYLGSTQRTGDAETTLFMTSLRRQIGLRGLLQKFGAYTAVLVAGVVSYDHFINHNGTGPFADTVIVVIATLIPLLVLLRQHFVGAEIERLQTSLVKASQDLETRVRERTQELADEKERLDVLNQAARDISGCSSVQEVLDAGAILLTRIKHSSHTAVSASGSRGELQFAGVAGMPASKQAQLRRVLRKFILSNAARSDPSPIVLDGTTVMVLFPIVYRQMLLGAACLASDDPHYELSPGESELIENIVSQLGVALDGVCRYDDARFLADNDALTGLANRRTITERLEQEIVRTQRAGSYFALLMMDVDKFKFCNDTYGHAVGDQVLVATAGALIQAVRAGDVVGRFGGDEFVAILPDTDLAGASYVVERISQCLGDHAVRVSGGELSLRLSCGTAIYPTDGHGAEELFHVADGRMYESKRRSNIRLADAGSTDGAQGLAAPASPSAV